MKAQVVIRWILSVGLCVGIVVFPWQTARWIVAVVFFLLAAAEEVQVILYDKIIKLIKESMK